MGMTFAEKVLARHAEKKQVQPGEIVEIQPDVALSHDNTAAIIGIFQKMGAETVFDASRLVIVLDHATPAPTTKHADNHRRIRAFVQEQGIGNFYKIGQGICHQIMVEEGHALPGEVVVGADSHTTHAGVMGAFAVGIGRTEMASVWAIGRIWLRVPESLRIEVQGEFPPYTQAKDLALRAIGKLGSDGALYQSVEWHGTTVAAMDISQRAVLANMMAEMGAKNAVIPPDGLTLQYLEGRAKRPFDVVSPDEDANYAERLEIDVSHLRPMIACPHSVDHVRPVEEIAGTPIHQAFLGTCTNGRLEDLAVAAEILEGRRLHPRTRMIVIPASARIYLEAMKAGYLETLIRAGAVIGTPGCGPCMGNHMGVPAEGEVTISTANRNFRGRMGTQESEIYLASPAVVAASAIAGEITHPAEVVGGSS